MLQTLTFQNTNSLEMIGCRSCFGKSEEDLYPTLNDCETCLTRNYDFYCGRYFTAMNKYRDLKNRKKCENQKWNVKRKGNLTKGECDRSHYCCFETQNNNSKIKNKDKEKMKSLQIHPRFLVDCDNYWVNEYVSNNDFYDACLIAGKANGYHYCSYNKIKQFNKIKQNIKEIKNFLEENNKIFTKTNFTGIALKFLSNNDSRSDLSAIVPVDIENFVDFLLENKKNFTKTNFTGIALKFLLNNDSSSDLSAIVPVDIDNLNKDENFECGILIKPKSVNIIGDTIGVDCGMDTCRIHLDSLHYHIDGMHDLQSWQTKITFHLFKPLRCSICYSI